MEVRLLGSRKEIRIRRYLALLSMNVEDHLADSRERELTMSYARRLMKRNQVDQLLCHKCGNDIVVGSRVHVQLGHGRFNRPISVYHQRCWESLFLEL